MKDAYTEIYISRSSSLLAGPLNTLFGRRWTILIGATFSTFAPWLSYTAKTPAQLCVYRILLGLGMGLKEVTVPIYTAEIAPTNIRGTLLMFWQLWLAFGILMGSLCNVVIAENVKSPTAKVKAWQYRRFSFSLGRFESKTAALTIYQKSLCRSFLPLYCSSGCA